MECIQCHKEIPEGAVHCAHCGAPVSGEAVSVIAAHLIPTTTMKRFLNALTDGIIIAVIASVIGSDSVWGVGALFLGFAYYFVSEMIWAKSPAKFLTKTKVVTDTGGKPSASQVAIRSLVRLIPFYAIFFIFTTGKDRRGAWHDRFAHTLVIDDK